MRHPQPNIYGHSIVLIGNFNPKIFQPAWFGAEGLLGKEEIDKANIEIVHSDIAIFSVDWLRIEVVRDRFKVETTQEPYDEAVRDFVLGTFTLLRHTPIMKMGINRDMHFSIETVDKWHAVGHKLAPKELWEGILDKPGLLSLTMQGAKNKEDQKGYIRVLIEPSKSIHPGLFIEVNDHTEVKDASSVVGCDELMGILKATWSDSYKRAESIIYALLDRSMR